MSSLSNKNTAKYETTIDDVFVRNLSSFQFKVFTLYFNDQKYIISFLHYDNIEQFINLQKQPQEDSAE